MTQQDLQSEVMEEIIKNKSKPQKIVTSQTIVSKKTHNRLDDEVEDTSFKRGTIEKQTTFQTEYNDYEDDGDMKHDRRE